MEEDQKDNRGTTARMIKKHSDSPLIDHYCPDSDLAKTKWKNKTAIKTVIAPCLHQLQTREDEDNSLTTEGTWASPISAKEGI